MISTADFIQKVPIFSTLTAEGIAILIPILREQRIKRGDILFSEGEDGKAMFIVRSGAFVSSVRMPDGKLIDIAEFRRGNFFGEMSIFEHAPRSATCHARQSGTLYELTGEDFSRLQEEHPSVAAMIMREMLEVIGNRLASTGEFLSEMVQYGENARKRAITDEFTGLFNRRFLDEALENLFFRAKSDARPLTVIMGDLDYFSTINRDYGHDVGDKVILAVTALFRKHFRECDIVARYGGDEFTFVLPNTTSDQAAEIASALVADVARLPMLRRAGGEITRIGTSQGIASFPEHADTLESLLEMADQALYAAKASGRSRAMVADVRMKSRKPAKVVQFRADKMFTVKRDIPTFAARNRIINSILDLLFQRNTFLIVGHRNPDYDCLGSMVAMSLLIQSLGKTPKICTASNLHHQYEYLINICRFNNIELLRPDFEEVSNVDTVIVCDTPKPDMLELGSPARWLLAREDVLKIEIDHHLNTDSRYSGHDDYCLVTKASSTCELIMVLACKLSKQRTVLERHHVGDLFPRNMVLSLLTGMVGDTQNGKILKSHRERRFYHLLSRRLNVVLDEKTAQSSNLRSAQDIQRAMEKADGVGSALYNHLISRTRRKSYIGYVALDHIQSDYLHRTYDSESVVNSIRRVADRLAEESKYVGMVACYDAPNSSNLIQFRVRRYFQYQKIDLRTILEELEVENGGGHEGAIGFRFPESEIPDFEGFVQRVVDCIVGRVIAQEE